MSLLVESKDLFVPSLEEVSTVLQRGLSKNFADVRVEVVDCPDLSSAPFSLTGTGLGGSPRIADVGGPPYLLPLVNKDKNYSIHELAKLVDLPDAFIVGAGAGPHKFVGVNSEMMANLTTGAKADNGSRVSKIIGDQYEIITLPQDQPNCALMLNLFASQGLPGKVLKVRARKRTGVENFVTCMRKTLDEKYQEQSVGLGGIFQLKSGSVKCHIMPEFSTCPLKSDDDVNNWLRFFNMPAPMVFFSVFISRDPGLDLRIEHSHGYGDSCGGHYHYDVTPDTVEYEGYFNIAERIFRIDRPTVTHNIGRD